MLQSVENLVEKFPTIRSATHTFNFPRRSWIFRNIRTALHEDIIFVPRLDAARARVFLVIRSKFGKPCPANCK